MRVATDTSECVVQNHSLPPAAHSRRYGFVASFLTGGSFSQLLATPSVAAPPPPQRVLRKLRTGYTGPVIPPEIMDGLSGQAVTKWRMRHGLTTVGRETKHHPTGEIVEGLSATSKVNRRNGIPRRLTWASRLRSRRHDAAKDTDPRQPCDTNQQQRDRTPDDKSRWPRIFSGLVMNPRATSLLLVSVRANLPRQRIVRFARQMSG